jgi:hypothetical protein
MFHPLMGLSGLLVASALILIVVWIPLRSGELRAKRVCVCSCARHRV